EAGGKGRSNTVAVHEMRVGNVHRLGVARERLVGPRHSQTCSHTLSKMHQEGPGFQFIADRGDSRLRLDQILVRRVTHVTHMSRNVAQKWIEAGAVTVD